MPNMPLTRGKKLLSGLMIILGGVAVLFLSYVLRMRVIDNVDEAIYGDMDAGINIIEQVFKDASHEQEQLVRFLFGTPPIAGLTRASENGGIDPTDGTNTLQWKKRLEMIFVSLMSQYAAIEQLRVIEVSGQESVRVERLQGKIRVVDAGELQNKANRDYVQAINQLAPDGIYFSEISLNQENNVVTLPYQPMIRVGMPIFDADGQTQYGMLVVNFDSTMMIQSMLSALRSRMSLVIVSESGDFIQHPDSIREFGRDLHSNHSWPHDYQNQAVLSDLYPEVSWYLDTQTNQRYLVLSKSISPAGDSSAHQANASHVIFHVLVAENFYLAEKAERDHFSVIMIIGAVILLLILIVLIISVFRARFRLGAIEEQNNVIIRSSVDAIIGLDAAGYLTIWNGTAEKLFGYSRHQVLTRNIDEFVLFNGFDSLPFRLQMMSDLQAKTIELEAVTTSGDFIPVSVSFTPIIRDSDQYLGIACMVRDISHYKNYQSELLKMAQGLEEQVIERTRELSTAHKTASEVNRLKSVFVSNLSHEIRTQLNNIMGTLGLIRKEPLTVMQQRFFQVIDNSTYTLLYLATDALELSSPDAGELVLKPEDFNLVALSEILISTMTIQAQQKKLELILDMSGVEWIVMRGDVSRIKQIIVNLVGNAIQYTDDGFVQVKMTSQLQEDGQIRLDGYVIDTGRGMTEKTQQKLFQGGTNSATSTLSSLFICKQVCELMSGDLQVKSLENEGSTFHFYFYLQPPKSQAPPIVKTLSGLSFEIYGPVPQVTESLKSMLVYFGGSVLHTGDQLESTGQEADVILLDTLSHQYTSVRERWESSVSSHPSHPPILIELYALFDGCPMQTGHITEGQKYIKYLHKPVFMSELLCVLNAEDPNLQWLVQPRLGDVFLTMNEEMLHRFAQTVVLIVDDNRINREVTATILESMGIQCLFANQGQQAIDLLSETGPRVDMIFMDCHMPIMDGYTCTTLIRHGEAGKEYQNIPIIAFTADAVPGERDQCLRVGMNDYLSKPVTSEMLIHKVQEYLRDVESITHELIDQESIVHKSVDHGVIDHETPLAPVAEASIPDQTIVTQKQEQSPPMEAQWNRMGALLRMMENEALLRQITQMYLDGAEEKQMQLKTAIEHMERQAIRDCSHAIKGLAADVGADVVAAILAEIETVALNGEQSVLHQKYGQFEILQEQVIHEMQLYLQN